MQLPQGTPSSSLLLSTLHADPRGAPNFRPLASFCPGANEPRQAEARAFSAVPSGSQAAEAQGLTNRHQGLDSYT